MQILNKPITSREHKLILRVEPFSERDKGSDSFMKWLGSVVEVQGGEVEKEVEEKERRVWYLDTPDQRLYQNNFSLRLREEMEASKKFKLTLKHRNPDRYLSASQDVTVATSTGVGQEDVETKFEEDILCQFVSKFAHSTSVRFNALPELRIIADVLAIFPGLSSLGASPDMPITRAKDFYEIKRESGKIDFGEKPKVKPCLSFWYPSTVATGQPVVAEFSFDYDVLKEEQKRLAEHPDSLEQFPLLVVKRSTAFFMALHQTQGAVSWFDLNRTTKTDWVYE